MHYQKDYNVPEGRVKPWGTAHAVLCAKPFINEPFAVINADDYYGVDGYKVMADFLTSHEEKDGKSTICNGWDIILEIQLQRMDTYPEVSVKLMTTTSYFLSQKELISKNVKIMQNSQKMTVQLGHLLPFDTLVSMNFFGFQPMIMDELEKGFPAFLDQAIKENPLKGEYFIPSVASDLLHDGKASLEVLVSKDQWYGVTYPEDKQSVIDALAALRENGTYKF